MNASEIPRRSRRLVLERADDSSERTPDSTAKCLGVLSFRDTTVWFRDYLMPLNSDDDRPALHVTRIYKDEASLQK